VQEVDEGGGEFEFLDCWWFKSPYKLKIPATMPGMTNPDGTPKKGHKLHLEKDGVGTWHATVDYYLQDDRDASAFQVELVDCDLLPEASAEFSPAANMPHLGQLLHTYADGPTGQVIAVFMAEDTHGCEYRDHCNKRMLAVNDRQGPPSARCVGYSLRWPPGETNTKAMQAGQQLKAAGFATKVESNVSNGGSIVQWLGQASVFFSFGHQDYEAGGALVFPAPADQTGLGHVFATHLKAEPPDFHGMGACEAFLQMPGATKCRNTRKVGLKPGALSGLYLAVYEGCNTGNTNTDDNFGNLLTVTTQLGAKCAMGWTKTIYGGFFNNEGDNDEPAEKSCAHLFAESFWEEWAKRQNGLPVAVRAVDAYNAALDALAIDDAIYTKYDPRQHPTTPVPWGNMDSAGWAGDNSVDQVRALNGQ